MNPRSDGSFALNPRDADDGLSASDRDIGPPTIEALPDDIQVRVYDRYDGDTDTDVWRDATYRPTRSS